MTDGPAPAPSKKSWADLADEEEAEAAAAAADNAAWKTQQRPHRPPDAGAATPRYKPPNRRRPQK